MDRITVDRFRYRGSHCNSVPGSGFERPLPVSGVARYLIPLRHFASKFESFRSRLLLGGNTKSPTEVTKFRTARPGSNARRGKGSTPRGCVRTPWRQLQQQISPQGGYSTFLLDIPLLSYTSVWSFVIFHFGSGFSASTIGIYQLCRLVRNAKKMLQARSSRNVHCIRRRILIWTKGKRKRTRK